MNKKRYSKKLILLVTLGVGLSLFLMLRGSDSALELVKSSQGKITLTKSEALYDSDQEQKAKNDNTLSRFKDLSNQDRLLVEKCRKSLSQGFTKINEFGDIKVTDFELLQRGLIADCSFKISSKEFLQSQLKHRDLDFDIFSADEVIMPYILVFNIFREFFKDKGAFKQHKSNLHSIVTLNLELAPATRFGSLYLWTSIVQEFLATCDIQTADEENFLYSELDKDKSRYKAYPSESKLKSRLSQTNQLQRERSEAILNHQQDLKQYFNKYDKEFSDCIRN